MRKAPVQRREDGGGAGSIARASPRPSSDTELSVVARAACPTSSPSAWLDRLLVAASISRSERRASRASRRWSTRSRRSSRRYASGVLLAVPESGGSRREQRVVQRLPERMRRARPSERPGPDAHLPVARARARRPAGVERERVDAARRVRRRRSRRRGSPAVHSSIAPRSSSVARSPTRAPPSPQLRRGATPRTRAAVRAAHDPGRQAGDVRPGRGGRRPRAEQPAHLDRRLLRLSHPQGREGSGGVARRDDVERLRRISESANRMLRFTRELVSYARPSGGAARPVALHDVIDQAVAFCEHVLSAAGDARRAALRRATCSPCAA